MKIYFSGALYQKEKLLDSYRRIVELLRKEGYKVLEDTLSMPLDKALEMGDEDRVRNYKNIVKWIDQADFSVIEGSFPSTLHIGHEITLALEKSKPVVVLYRTGAEPTVFRGLKDDRIIWAEYNDQNLEKVLVDAVEEAKKTADVRFNFFVSPKILAYLDWVAQKRMIPRSVYLRNLIEKEMRKNKEFNG
ncbi:hypothetical protein HYV64_05100 [Candidatus Shapirobacteria bacterium]|nr:hypothetical protein [Candidatus Shapirobacteria bacterium]